jgi:EthD domain
MVKIVFCLRRKAGLSLEEFQTYWFAQHAPKVVERARKLGIRRYVQSHSIADPRLTGMADQRNTVAEPFDGIAELWFDSAEVLYPHDNVPDAIVQAGKDLLVDEACFIDLEQSPIFFVQEREILTMPATSG